MKTQEKKLITQICDLVSVYPVSTFEEFIDEMFQNHLECTTMSGRPLANGYYFLTQLKQVFKTAESLLHPNHDNN